MNKFVARAAILAAVASLSAAAQYTPSMSGGLSHTLAVRSDGRALAWGWNDKGQLGTGAPIDRSEFPMDARSSIPVQVVALNDIVRVTAGDNTSYALLADGSVWGWGQNQRAQLGDGTTVDTSTPVRIRLPAPARAISARDWMFLAALEDGSVWMGGRFNPGPDFLVAGPIAGISDVVDVAAGSFHGLLLRNDGTVWSFGSNFDGQLGYPTSPRDGTFFETPRQVPGLSNIVAIAVGYFTSFAVAMDGTLWSWGQNEDGQLGDGTSRSAFLERNLTPRRAAITDVAAVSVGGHFSFAHVVALKRDGTVWAWGNNVFGQVGDGTDVSRSLPRQVAGIREAVGIAAGGGFSVAMLRGGAVLPWGYSPGGLGDGTFAARRAPAIALDTLGKDFLDLTPGDPVQVPAEFAPVFKTLARGGGAPVSSRVEVRTLMQFRPEDVGTRGSVYVFALAPPALVLPAAGEPHEPLRLAKAASGAKDEPLACVLAQLNSSGRLVAVNGANLQDYLTGILDGQGASVAVLDNVSTAAVAGSTFYVGYGPSADAMFRSGNNRSVASVDGLVQCRPQPPQTGWWWNPAEDGRGYSIEARGGKLFFASFLYDVSGRSTWLVADGRASVDGSLFQTELLSARGGQTLGGAYAGFPQLASAGNLVLAFHDATRGTLVWPGGSVPIRRFDIVPGGLGMQAVAGQPESGWWWNEQEAGRGFFMEFQGGHLDIAGYMYDAEGQPVWYLTVGEIAGTPTARTFSGNWWRYGNGQTLTGMAKPATRIDSNVAPLTITFTGAETALMTLPNGRSTSLRRHRF